MSESPMIDWTVQWRQRQRKPDPVGHYEGPALLEHRRSPVWDMTEPATWMTTEAENTFVQPDQVTLVASVRPISVLPHQGTLQYVYNGVTMSRYPLYGQQILALDQKSLGAQSSYKGIQLVYQGSGSVVQEGRTHYFKGSTWGVWTWMIPPRGVLATLNYEVMPEEPLVIDQKTVGGQEYYTPPGVAHAVLLYPFGVRYHAALGLEESVQVYMQPSFSAKETRIALFTETYLKQQGVKPPHKGVWNDRTVIFMKGVGSGCSFSLHEFLVRGQAKISCSLGGQEGTARTYQSFRYHWIDRGASLIEIVFAPE